MSERKQGPSTESQLLSAITRAQTQFVQSQDARIVFDGMLEALLTLTDSEYGFIGEVFNDADGSPFLRTHAITNIAWNAETQRFYDDNVEKGLEFRNMNTLFGHVITSGTVVIANEPHLDRRGAGTPKGHPPLNAFLGLPFYHRDKLIGMVGIANRPAGYDEALVESLKPFLTTCANIILSIRAQNDQSAIARSLLERGPRQGHPRHDRRRHHHDRPPGQDRVVQPRGIPDIRLRLERDDGHERQRADAEGAG